MARLLRLVVTILVLAAPLTCGESWDSWYTCNYGFKHYAGKDPRLGEIVAQKLVCLRPNCGWQHTGNQFTALGEELNHWKVHVPDKKMQKKQRKHYSVDGPHYAAVEGQPQQ